MAATGRVVAQAPGAGSRRPGRSSGSTRFGCVRLGAIRDKSIDRVDDPAEETRAADATLGWWGPDGFTRLVVATADPGTLPDKATWYLVTNLPRPGSPREADSPHPPADLAEITRIYGIRHWIEQSYKQVKDELGWADFQVRSDIAIRRHQVLVNCAFSFCWAARPAPPAACATAGRPRAPRSARRRSRRPDSGSRTTPVARSRTRCAPGRTNLLKWPSV